jgi:putative polyhydroxyalkanoate system protein
VPDIHIVRTHLLGLGGARQLAEHWIRDAERSHGMQCVREPGTAQDRVVFQQAGVQGVLTVTPERFELTAELGFLYRGFKDNISRAIESQLDNLLAAPSPSLPPGGQPTD